MPVFGSAVKRVLDEGGVAYGDDIVKIVTPLGYGGCAEYCMSIGLTGPKERITGRMLTLMQEAYLTSIEAKPQVEAALRELKARGHSLNILTASPHDVLDPCLKRIGIIDLFDNIWSCTDFGTTKADPNIYSSAAERLGKEVCDIVFLDDNTGACKTAKLAGAEVIGVYDPSSDEYIDDMKACCDSYIYSFKELIW